MRGEPWVEFQNVEAWLSDKSIFQNLSLTLYKNESTAIIGPNGAGKSTLIKLIERSIYPVIKKDSRMLFYGKERVNLWKLRSLIGFVSNEIEDRIPNNSSSKDVIYSGFFGSNTLRKETILTNKQKDSANKIINDFNLVEFELVNYGCLSEGLKRRVLLARALVNNPQIIILDEPVCKLDLKSKYDLLSLLEKLSVSGTTLVQVTHNIDTVIKDTKRVVLIKRGVVIADGIPHECLNSDILSNLYETPLIVHRENGFWQVYPGTQIKYYK